MRINTVFVRCILGAVLIIGLVLVLFNAWMNLVA